MYFVQRNLLRTVLGVGLLILGVILAIQAGPKSYWTRPSGKARREPHQPTRSTPPTLRRPPFLQVYLTLAVP